MWETICDALASWSGWEFGSKIPVYPILGFDSQNTPPPAWKLKFRQILAFKDFSILTCGEYPSPPPNWNLGRSWHFKTFQFWLVEKTPRRYVETNICIPHGYRLVCLICLPTWHHQFWLWIHSTLRNSFWHFNSVKESGKCGFTYILTKARFIKPHWWFQTVRGLEQSVCS